MRFFLTLLLFSFITDNLCAQASAYGEPPSYLKWKQINTPNFQIILSDDYVFNAQRIANVFEKAHENVKITMSSPMPRIPIIMHSQSAISNGITYPINRRIELYPIAYQNNLYAHDWIEQLAVHEYRHACQFNKLNNGYFTHILSKIFGQGGTAVISSFIPSFIYEGDAVLTETRLSNSGRGRQPWFYMPTRAMLLNKKGLYSYRKVGLGSYRSFIPDHYEFGFLYVGATAEEYGVNVWDNIFFDVGDIFLFPLAIRFNTHMPRAKLYRHNFKKLRENWQTQDLQTTKTAFEKINTSPNRSFTNYRFPSYTDNSTVIAEKSGLDTRKKIVSISPEGKEKTLYLSGMSMSDNLSVEKSLITWNEYRFDPRWRQKSYSVIKTLDLQTGEVKSVTGKQKYFYPVLSPDASKIACIEYTKDHHYRLTIIKSDSNEILNSYPTPHHLLPMNHCWSADGKEIFSIINSDKGKSIQALNTETGLWRLIFFPPHWEMYQLRANEEYLFFRTGYTGIENIFAIHLSSNKVYQVTSSQFGAFDPYIKNDILYYSDYTADGYKPVKIKIDSSLFVPAETITPYKNLFSNKLLVPSDGIVDSSSIENVTYKIEPYKKSEKLLKIHSWLPFYLDINTIRTAPNMVIPGITVFSQNSLSTLNAYGGIAYGLFRQAPFIFGGITYSGLYPVINYEATYSTPQMAVYDTTKGRLESIDTMQLTSMVRISVPLNFSRGAYNIVIRPETGFSFNKEKIKSNISANRIVFSPYARLQSYALLSQSNRDITSRLGIGTDILYSQGVKNSHGYSVSKGYIFLPGIFKHQSIRVNFEHSAANENDIFIVAGEQRPARGYDVEVNTFNETKNYNQLTKYTFDYFTPLLYPDLNIFGFMYIPRIWTSIFYDYSDGRYLYNNQVSSRILQSYGYELYFDIHFLHYPIPISIGFQQSYLINENRTVNYILLNTSLLTF